MTKSEEMNGIKKLIVIRFKTDEEAREALPTICDQLVGNRDYIDNNIVINDHITRMAVTPTDDTIGEIHIYVFDECTDIPKIVV